MQLINADPEAVNLAKSELNAFARVNGVDVSAGRFFVSSSGRLTLSLDIDKERGVEGDLDGSFSGCEYLTSYTLDIARSAAERCADLALPTPRAATVFYDLSSPDSYQLPV